LVLDDIHIPTVHNLFRFLRRDALFKPGKVVRKTAFFKRTSAQTFDPFGDGWWQQKYNARPLLRYSWREEVKRLLPVSMHRSAERMKRKVLRRSSDIGLEILLPQSGAIVTGVGMVEGSARIPIDSFLRVLARRRGFDGWWPQGSGAVPVDQGQWRVSVTCGGPQDTGCDFELAALGLWTEWVTQVKETGLFPPVHLPPAGFVRAEAFQIVAKAQSL
jgi:hypothetical protein